MYTEVEILRCPSCGTKVTETIRQDGFKVAATTIGPAFVPCPRCGCVLFTGNSEWDDKTFPQQLWFIAQRVIWLLVSSLSVGLVIAFFVGYLASEFRFLNQKQVEHREYVAYGITIALFACQFFRNAAKEIRDSRSRTRNEGAG